MEFEAVDEGVVGKIVVPEGTEGVKVNDLIAVLLEEGESADAIGAAAPKPAAKPDGARRRRRRSRAHGRRAGCSRACPGPGRRRADLRLAARAPHRRREGHRPRRGQGLGPERPDRQGRRGGGEARCRAAAAGRCRRPPRPSARPGGGAAGARRRGGQEALRRPRVRGGQARRNAPDDRRPAQRGQVDDPALLPAPRDPPRRAARLPLAAQQGARGAGREALGQRLHHQGVRHRAPAGARLQRRLGRRPGAPDQVGPTSRSPSPSRAASSPRSCATPTGSRCPRSPPR